MTRRRTKDRGTDVPEMGFALIMGILFADGVLLLALRKMPLMMH